jgi:hypothetical protein
MKLGATANVIAYFGSLAVINRTGHNALVTAIAKNENHLVFVVSLLNKYVLRHSLGLLKFSYHIG